MQNSAIERVNLEEALVAEQVVNDQRDYEIRQEDTDIENEKRIRQEAYAAEGAGQNIDAEV